MPVREGVYYPDYESEMYEHYWEQYGIPAPQLLDKRGQKERSIWDSLKGSKSEEKKPKESISYVLKDYDIDIPQKIYDELMHAVRELGKESLEVGGLLKVKRTGTKFEVLDWCLLKQEVGGADFTISEPEMAKWAMTKMDEPDFNLWNAWWHSHHTMGLFWSGTDDEMFKKLRGEKVGGECFGIVFTTDGKYRTRFDVNTPLGPVIFDELSSDKSESAEAADTKKVETLIEQNVEKPKPIVYTWGGHALTSKGWRDDDWASRHLMDFALKKKFFDALSSPYTVEDILEQSALRAKFIKGWCLEKECAIWHIDNKKLTAYLEKVRKREDEERKKKGGKDDAVDSLYD